MIQKTDQKFDQVVSILTRHSAQKISVFGSYARGEADAKSDLDILVVFTERKSLMDIVGIEIELSEALELKVDLLTEKSISPHLIDRIKDGAKVIYG